MEEVTVELVGRAGEAIVRIVDGDRSWSTGFDLLTGDVDDVVADLEGRMNREVRGESPLAVLVRRRVAGARAELREKLGGEVIEGGKGPGGS